MRVMAERRKRKCRRYFVTLGVLSRENFNRDPSLVMGPIWYILVGKTVYAAIEIVSGCECDMELLYIAEY